MVADMDHVSRRMIHMARARALMYTSIYLAISEVPEHIRMSAIDLLSNMHKELAESLAREADRMRDLKARNHRRDLDPVARTMLPKAIEMCYSNSGYVVEEDNPDSLKAMLVFLSRLIEDEAKALVEGRYRDAYKLRKIQLRFINTHLKPLIEEARKNTDLKTLEILEDILDNDVEYLKLSLVNPDKIDEIFNPK